MGPTVPNSQPLVSDHVFGTLLEALLTGRYAAGEQLPGQRALAGDLGVTLGSLREALKRLEQMGLIDVRHGDGMRVRDWREYGGLDVLAHALFRGGTLDPGVLGAVLEARSLMLREIAALAAQRRSGDQAARLHELAGAFARADDARAAARIDFAFFTEVAQAAHNLVFVLILNAIRELYLDNADRLPVTAGHHELAPRYTAIAAAIADADAARAAAEAYSLAGAQRERVGLP